MEVWVYRWRNLRMAVLDGINFYHESTVLTNAVNTGVNIPRIQPNRTDPIEKNLSNLRCRFDSSSFLTSSSFSIRAFSTA